MLQEIWPQYFLWTLFLLTIVGQFMNTPPQQVSRHTTAFMFSFHKWLVYPLKSVRIPWKAHALLGISPPLSYTEPSMVIYFVCIFLFKSVKKFVCHQYLLFKYYTSLEKSPASGKQLFIQFMSSIHQHRVSLLFIQIENVVISNVFFLILVSQKQLCSDYRGKCGKIPGNQIHWINCFSYFNERPGRYHKIFEGVLGLRLPGTKCIPALTS